MSDWAKPGVQCVCLRKTPWINIDTFGQVPHGPAFNEICTIAFVLDDPDFGIGLSLFGHCEPDGVPSIYPIFYFRPLVPQETEVALFASSSYRMGEPA
jgi:hypothetical protein